MNSLQYAFDRADVIHAARKAHRAKVERAAALGYAPDGSRNTCTNTLYTQSTAFHFVDADGTHRFGDQIQIVTVTALPL